MRHPDKRARDLAKLEEVQLRVRERMAAEQVKIDKRFERMRQKLTQKYGETSDGQQRIIDASLELLKQDGLANITLRKLASTIDMKAPALYWYFKSKEELVDYMAEAILEKEFTDLQPRRDDEPWQDWLIQHMVRLRQAMLAYPDGARVVAGARLYPAVTLAKLMEAGAASLHSAGVDLKIAHHLVTTTTTYTFGYVIEEQAAPTEAELADFDISAFLESYPHLAHALTDHDHSPQGQNEDYLTGLRWIIQGAAAI